MHHWQITAFFWLNLMLFSNCATMRRLDLSPADLRAEVLRQDPTLSADAIVVPYEVSPELIARAKSLTQRAQSNSEKVYFLRDALTNPRGFNLHYAIGVTTTAEETVSQHAGNCLSLAAVFVGLARAIGLRAHFADFSVRMQNVYKEQDLLVKTGHISAVVDTESGLMTMDFGRQLGQNSNYRIIDDLEATAHFYNNRGYDIIHQALGSQQPIDWEEVAHTFKMAARVKPDFVRAWNNLGVASSRLGRFDQALESYRQALALDPDFFSAAYNLGILQLSKSNLAAALEAFDQTVRIDNKNPRVHYQRAVVLYRLKQYQEAAQAIQQALELDASNPKAQSLRSQILLQLSSPTQ